MSNVSDDPYLYPGTTVLRNRKGLRDPALLEEFEAAAVLRRYLEIRQAPLPPLLDADHLRALHRDLFQDVYSWAGEFRITRLGKEEFAGGRVRFFAEPTGSLPNQRKLLLPCNRSLTA
jgi:fido (protein-threonine AMPylation protein)